MKIDFTEPPPPWLMLLALFCFIAAQFLHNLNSQRDRDDLLRSSVHEQRMCTLAQAKAILSRNHEDQSARDFLFRH